MPRGTPRKYEGKKEVMRQICDHGDKAGNACGKGAVWVIVLPSEGDAFVTVDDERRRRQYACHQHLAAVLLGLYEFFRLTQTDPAFTVMRW